MLIYHVLISFLIKLIKLLFNGYIWARNWSCRSLVVPNWACVCSTKQFSILGRRSVSGVFLKAFGYLWSSSPPCNMEIVPPFFQMSFSLLKLLHLISCLSAVFHNCSDPIADHGLEFFFAFSLGLWTLNTNQTHDIADGEVQNVSFSPCFLSSCFNNQALTLQGKSSGAATVILS